MLTTTDLRASASELVTRCHQIGITLTLTASGVTCRAPRGVATPELRDALKANRVGIRELLTAAAAAGGDNGTPESSDHGEVRIAPASSNWPADLGAAADFVMLIVPEDLPATPIALHRPSVVVDAAKYLRSLQADVRSGPSGPRARSGALQHDLRRLREVVLAHATKDSRIH